MIVFVFSFVYTVEGVCKSATKGLQKGLTILLFHLSLGLLGNVEHCSLVNATNITVDCRKYCAILKKGLYQGNETFEECKAMNARVVLPKSQKEMTAFLKFSPGRTWIGLWNAKRAKGKESWKDTTGAKAEYANLRVITSIQLVFSSLLIVLSF